ncbi:hypothetical protein KFK09_001476 [Dendrobium nobile]|uniref:Uncharacterized protein n=1 Tax=Dendrobium nobile TaxID=94219 RepID=A0A8T3CB06_DENNO|nr:hypothetical protein KFK09_001476 [Dendrobium nobile]
MEPRICRPPVSEEDGEHDGADNGDNYAVHAKRMNGKMSAHRAFEVDSEDFYRENPRLSEAVN